MPPVRHQGDIGWCYAYTAADLLSARLGRPVSAVDIAMIFNERVSAQIHSGIENLVKGRNPFAPETRREGGFIGDAVRDVAERGVCWETDVPSQNLVGTWSQLGGYFRWLEQQIDTVDQRSRQEGIAAPYTGGYDTDPPPSAFVQPGYETQERGQVCSPGFKGDPGPLGDKERGANSVCRSTYDQARAVFPNLTRENYFNALATRSKVRLLQSLDNASCRRQPLNPAPSVIDDWKSRVPEAELYRRIEEQLKAGTPVGVSYDARVLNDALRAKHPDEEMLHASVLVGRRWNPQAGVCELLLRNSWGADCSYYDLSYACSSGHVWIPADKLMKSVQGITYLR